MHCAMSNVGSIHGHGVAEIHLTLGHSAAVKTDKVWSTRELLNVSELACAGQYA
jgi:hypothetical protein